MLKQIAIVSLALVIGNSALAAKAKSDPEAYKARRTACSQDWQKTKAELKAQGQTWPKFWHDCNTRLKGVAAK